MYFYNDIKMIKISIVINTYKDLLINLTKIYCLHFIKAPKISEIYDVFY